MKAVFSSPLIPTEWIAAHGWSPCRLPARPATEPPPSGACAYAWAWMLSALSEPDAGCIILTTDCDMMRRLPEEFATRSSLPVFLFTMPRVTGRAIAHKIFRSELERLGRFLVHLGGHAPTPPALEDLIWVYEKTRREAQPQIASEGIALALLGGPLMPQHAAIGALIMRTGGTVVLDASETGEISLPSPPDPELLGRDPLSALAGMYYDGIPSIHHRPNKAMYEWLAPRLAQRGVRGILHFNYPWCDAWHAEARRIEDWAPVPILSVVLSATEPLTPQFTTCIEAFLEALR